MARKKAIKKIQKRQNGITLVALVVTIVILIILATVTINATFGENGLLKKAQEAKDMTTNAIKAEEESMNEMLEEYANIIAEEPEIPVPEEPEGYVDSVLAVAPEISDGMVPVKWDSTKSKWVKTTVDDEKWYNYANKEWANVVLTPTSGEKEGKDATGTVDVFNEDGTLNESSAYSMLVWIPRYAYQITSQYHTSGSTAGNIDIVFIDTNNQNKDKTKTYSEEYPSYTTGSGMSDFVVHPAFNYGTTKLAGFWVGKYETSHTECTTTESTGSTDTNVTTLTATIRPNVTSWRNISISNIYTVCTELNKAGNPYGLNSNDMESVDPHLMKNTEWGAVAYLSQNTTYGKGTEVTINDNSSYIAADGSYISNASQSTTGNVWGIYDMSGGAYEYTAAYVNNGHSNLTDANYGKNVYEAEAKYKDVYQATSTSGSDSQSGNYNLLNPKEKYGDAVYETSNSYSGSTSWYSDYSSFPYSNYPFLGRGGFYISGSDPGLFSFDDNAGGSDGSNYSSRVVLPVM